MKKVLRVITVVWIASFVWTSIGIAQGTNTVLPQLPLASAESKSSAGLPAEKGAAAMQEANSGNKHFFIFFYDKDDNTTAEARQKLASYITTIPETAQWMAINRNDPAEQNLVKQFKVKKAPMPLVIAVAPNGAITGGFREKEINAKNLENAIASPNMQKCLKALQEGKLVFVCVQNKSTKNNEVNTQGVSEFLADPRFTQIAEQVLVDPNNASEAKLLSSFDLNPKTEEAVTVFIAPPGTILQTYKGAVSKKDLETTLRKATAGGCGPGVSCGPNGCS